MLKSAPCRFPRTFSHEKLRELEDALYRAKHIASVTTISNSEQGVQFNRIIRYKRKVLERALRITAEETRVSFDTLAVRYGLTT